MTDMRVFAQNQNVSRGPTGGKAARGLLDGTLATVPWVQALIMEGYGLSANYGNAANSATTVGTFGAGGIDLDEFDLLQTLPAAGSVGVIPILFQPVLEAGGPPAPRGPPLPTPISAPRIKPFWRNRRARVNREECGIRIGFTCIKHK